MGVFLRSAYINDPNDVLKDALDSVCRDFFKIITLIIHSS